MHSRHQKDRQGTLLRSWVVEGEWALTLLVHFWEEGAFWEVEVFWVDHLCSWGARQGWESRFHRVWGLGQVEHHHQIQVKHPEFKIIISCKQIPSIDVQAKLRTEFKLKCEKQIFLNE